MLVPRGLPLKNLFSLLRLIQSHTLAETHEQTTQASNRYRYVRDHIRLIGNDEVRIEGVERKRQRKPVDLNRVHWLLPPAARYKNGIHVNL